MLTIKSKCARALPNNPASNGITKEIHLLGLCLVISSKMCAVFPFWLSTMYGMRVHRVKLNGSRVHVTSSTIFLSISTYLFLSFLYLLHILNKYSKPQQLHCLIYWKQRNSVLKSERLEEGEQAKIKTTFV